MYTSETMHSFVDWKCVIFKTTTKIVYKNDLYAKTDNSLNFVELRRLFFVIFFVNFKNSYQSSVYSGMEDIVNYINNIYHYFVVVVITDWFLCHTSTGDLTYPFKKLLLYVYNTPSNLYITVPGFLYDSYNVKVLLQDNNVIIIWI